MSQVETLPEVPAESPFQFQDHPIRTQIEGDTLWFVARDICEALGIVWKTGKGAGNSGTLSSIPAEWQDVKSFLTLGGRQKLRVITEPAVYKLAFRSNKPEADAFTNWVASEVVPSIRKTGKFEAAPTTPSSPITPADQSILQSIVKAKVEALPEERRSKGLYPQIWGRFNNHFRLGSYRQLPQCRMADAVAYLTQLAVREPAQALPPTIESLRVTDNAASADLDAHLDAIQEHIRAIFDHQCSIFRLGRNALPSRSAVPSRVWGASVLTLDSLEKSSDALRACLASLELSARAAVVAGRA